jgi:hypothetical protein
MIGTICLVLVCTFALIIGWLGIAVFVGNRVDTISDALMDSDKLLRMQRELYYYREIFEEIPEVACVLNNLVMLDTYDGRYIQPEMLLQTARALQARKNKEEVCSS